MVTALDDALNTMVRRLKRLKARYRKDYLWKHRRAAEQPERALDLVETPLPVLS